jgi:hypothetical protein
VPSLQSANTARAAGCLGKGQGAARAETLSRGLWRVWRVWRHRCPYSLRGAALRSVPVLPSALPAVPGMVMVAPVPMWVPVIAPRVVSPIRVSVMTVAVVPPAHHDDRRGSDHNGRRDAEAYGDIDAGLSGLGLREQCKSQEWDHTTHAYDICETFHCYILAVQHRLCSTPCRVIGHILPHIRCCVVYSHMTNM